MTSLKQGPFLIVVKTFQIQQPAKKLKMNLQDPIHQIDQKQQNFFICDNLKQTINFRSILTKNFTMIDAWKVKNKTIALLKMTH